MRPLTPQVLSSFLALTTPPDQGQVEYKDASVLVKTHSKGAVIAEFDLTRVCDMVNAYVQGGQEKLVDLQSAFRDSEPIRGNSNVRRIIR